MASSHRFEPWPKRRVAARADRWPTPTRPCEIPIDGEPADVTEIVADYARWMAQNDAPRLFVNAAPGAILIGAQREYCRDRRLGRRP